MKRSILQQLDITDNLIDRYISNNSITIKNDEVFINSSSLAKNIFLLALKKNIQVDTIINSVTNDIKNYLIILNKLYNKDLFNINSILNSIKNEDLDKVDILWVNIYKFIFMNINVDIDFPYETSSYLGNHILLLKKYIQRKEYKLAYTLLKYNLSNFVKSNIQFEILLNVLSALDDNLTYIIDEENDLDDVTINGVRDIERRLLVNLEVNDYDFLSNISLLKTICPNTITKNIFLLLIQLDKFTKNKTYVSSHVFLSNFGPIDEVIMSLINTNDYYRIRDLVDEQLNNNPTSIKLKIYKIIIDKIMYFNNKNMECIKLRTSSSITQDNYEDVLRGKHLNSIDISLIKDEYIGIDLSHNYYELYLTYKENGELEEAKKCLMQFKTNMDYLNIKCEIDYLLKELEIDILNKTRTKREQELVDSLYNRLNLCTELDEKIKICQELLKYDHKKNPHTLIYIAECYRKMNKLNDAINYYYMAENIYLYPIDYIKMIEILIDLKQYNKAIEYAFKYQFIKDDENGYVHYLMSIAYIYLKEYKCSEDALLEVERINELYNNVEYDLSIELKVVRDLMKHKKVSIYKKEDFIDFTLNHEEENIRKSINEDSRFNFGINAKISSYDPDAKIDYLMSILKVCNYLDKNEFGKKVINLTYKVLDNQDSIKDKEMIHRKLSIYQKNFTQKKL